MLTQYLSVYTAAESLRPKNILGQCLNACAYLTQHYIVSSNYIQNKYLKNAWNAHIQYDYSSKCFNCENAFLKNNEARETEEEAMSLFQFFLIVVTATVLLCCCVDVRSCEPCCPLLYDQLVNGVGDWRLSRV